MARIPNLPDPNANSGTYDFDTAIRSRFKNIQDMSDSATSWANFEAQKRKNAQSAADSIALYNAQVQGANQNTGFNPSNFISGGSNGTSGTSSTGNSSFDQFRNSLKQVESGGNYNVVNSIGATGAYQILSSNIPSWSKTALGYSVTPAQFRASPQIQDQVATYYLKGYYDKYGPAGAAIAWYAGEGSAQKYAQTGVNKYPGYVNKVLGGMK